MGDNYFDDLANAMSGGEKREATNAEEPKAKSETQSEYEERLRKLEEENRALKETSKTVNAFREALNGKAEEDIIDPYEMTLRTRVDEEVNSKVRPLQDKLYKLEQQQRLAQAKEKLAKKNLFIDWDNQKVTEAISKEMGKLNPKIINSDLPNAIYTAARLAGVVTKRQNEIPYGEHGGYSNPVKKAKTMEKEREGTIASILNAGGSGVDFFSR